MAAPQILPTFQKAAGRVRICRDHKFQANILCRPATQIVNDHLMTSHHQARYPTVADLFVGMFHSGPRDLMCPHLLVGLSRMRGKGVVERLAVDALRMSGQMMAHRFRKVGIGSIRHIFLHRSFEELRTTTARTS